MGSGRSVVLGGLMIGQGAPIRVESMLKTPLLDPEGCLAELEELAEAGCELVRSAYTSLEQEPLLSRLVEASPLPVMADIHFNHRLALSALAAGCPSVRVNPGNLGGEGPLREVLEEAERTGAVLRLGANGGSLNRAQLEGAGGDRGLALARAVEEQLRVLLDRGFHRILLSAKSSHVGETVRANQLLASRYDFPLHVGITEAGPPEEGTIRSSVGLGLLLSQGIGDTLRVSLSAPGVQEVRVGYGILRALDLRQRGVRWVSCPTCGRRRIEVARWVERLRPLTKDLPDGFTLAVMGCEVNGPREAAEADLGVAGAPGGFVLFRKGRPLGSWPEEELSRRVEEALRETLLGS